MVRFLLLYKSMTNTNPKQPLRAPSQIHQPPHLNGKGLFLKQIIKFSFPYFFCNDMLMALNVQNHPVGIAAEIVRSICYDRPGQVPLDLPGIFKKEGI
jgi:hypothetical protein